MEQQSYRLPAKMFHWSTMLMMVVVVVIALLPKGPFRASVFDLHKQLGMLIMLLAIPRLAYRFRHRPPPLPDHLPRFEQIIAHLAHYGMYILMFLIPSAGFLMSEARGNMVELLGVALPMIIEPDKQMYLLFKETHMVLAYTMLALLFGHAGAALRHHFIIRDTVLSRMLPGWFGRNRFDLSSETSSNHPALKEHL